MSLSNCILNIGTPNFYIVQINVQNSAQYSNNILIFLCGITAFPISGAPIYLPSALGGLTKAGTKMPHRKQLPKIKQNVCNFLRIHVLQVY
ncbi:MAG: hypothetical protein A2455_07360 [Ignavibacteria bacterium RIFOXYC2_FULL_35_16]|nr:MAG: hypothetical protein A2058_00295 [Ignavibacteria bacterium GWA2_36_19]OGU54684.1 MAG: hypothetical protein A2006_05340 [Ignavibacteria bacterium GWC2_35_8]OGU78507.1 MAG: hypothetical protein A2254_04470 [Ignavibacteria bacterium RIFOXYA2_FULL_35_9]OGU95650.1 MAG: hypothetical protein A2347_00430 [Ignavibacteria bacterium RIFOXYB12_FULL_35_14]OGU99104.1 MAG: hypothetical protein A2455_07360 [Ignavibacteria bacterium RIFOXYC2_FULL_35_16]